MSGVEFTCVIKVDEYNEWLIEITDKTDDTVEICKTWDEYKEKFESMSEPYGGNIDKVEWSQDANIPPQHIDEIRMEMAKLQAEVEEKTGRPLMEDNKG